MFNLQFRVTSESLVSAYKSASFFSNSRWGLVNSACVKAFKIVEERMRMLERKLWLWEYSDKWNGV